MFPYLWREGHHHFIVAIKGKSVNQFTVDPDSAEARVQELDRQGWDVYYAPAGFDTGAARTRDNAVYVPAFWMDVDCGDGKMYADHREALQALIRWLEKRHLPAPTHIVHSGGGLHVYWVFDAGVAAAQWQPVADRFKRLAAADRICDDPGVIADRARILRIPGTHNYKGGDARPVTLLHESDLRVRLEQFAEALPDLGPKPAERRVDEWSVDTPLPPGDAEAIADACAQVGAIRAAGGAVPEPEWRAFLSVLWRCENGEYYIHEWSKGDPRYDARETQRKAESTAGPATCQHFSELNPERCQGCPLRGKITSPVQARLKLPPPTPEQAPDAAPWRLNQTRSFTISSGGVFGRTGEDVTTQVTIVPLWVVEVRERAKASEGESDASTLLLEWVHVDGRRKRAVIPQAAVYNPQQLRAWAAAENLAAAVIDWKGLAMFISQYTIESLKGPGVREYHDQLGWHGDDNEAFVLGDTLVTADGPRPALVQSSNPIARVTRSKNGSAQGWAEGVAALASDRYLPLQFAIQAGFGSPLLHLAHLQSAVIALVGPPGTGKTLTANAALSIYGDPQWLRQGAHSSPKAIEMQLGCNRHVPYMIDEITQWPAKKAGDICYTAANGQGDSKLTRTRDNAKVGTWRLVPFVTGNRALTDYSALQLTDAHRARLIELFVPDMMDPAVGRKLHEGCVAKNAGHPALPYLQYVMQHKAELAALVQQAVGELSHKAGLPPSYRFVTWTLAVAAVGGAVARGLGLLQWDTQAAIQHAIESVRESLAVILDPMQLAKDLLAEWLTSQVDNIVHWPLSDRLVATSARDPIARTLGNGTIALHRRRVNDLLADAGVSRKAVKELFEEPMLVNESRLQLAPGTPAVWCYVMRQRELGIDLPEQTTR